MPRNAKSIEHAAESITYKIGKKYTRADIYDLLNIPNDQRRGDWLNGYHRHDNDYYIFCNIGNAGRTGHDYDNHWDGETLIWHGKTQSHFGQPAIKNLLSDDFRKLVFYRNHDRSPFTYAGIGHPKAHLNIEKPVRIDWLFNSEDLPNEMLTTDEFPVEAKYTEGTRVSVTVNRYERDRGARDACIKHHKAICQICSFNFEETYGSIGKDFIHVHHIVPISEVGKEYTVDPVKDLRPVCPNCHAIIHRQKPMLSIEKVKQLIDKQKVDNQLNSVAELNTQ